MNIINLDATGFKEREKQLEEKIELPIPNIYKKDNHGKEQWLARPAGEEKAKWTEITEEEYNDFKNKKAAKAAARRELKIIRRLNFHISQFIDIFRDFQDICFENIKKYPPEMPEKTESDFYPENLCYRTEKGGLVRSKSELIIANALDKYHIPYFYEPAIFDGKIHPDFMIPENIICKTVIWEHFGMMDSPYYVCDCLTKIKLYETNGYFQNDNLICTFEYRRSEENQGVIFDSFEAESVIRRFFLPDKK